MKINPQDGGEWISPQYVLLNGRIRTKGIKFPRRERVMVRKALERLHTRYREIIPIVNPYYSNWKDTHSKAISWLDFTVFHKRLMVILFHPRYGTSGVKPHEWKSFYSKQEYLNSKKIPFIVVKRKHTSYEYEILIRKMFRAYDNQVQEAD